tara:strand:- start:466 stop:870 length:405 start_codon:yes stop_codon:yes gene_type:complete
MWRKFNPKIKVNFTGIYALYLDHKLIYIGYSTSVPSRLKKHEISYDLAKYKKIDDHNQAKALEEKLIRRLTPSFNKDFIRPDVETKAFSCQLELDVWKAIKIKHAIKDKSVADIVNEALREQLKRWVEIGNQAS